MIRWSLVLLAAGLWACSGGESDNSSGPSSEPDGQVTEDGQAGVEPETSSDVGAITDVAVAPPSDPADGQGGLPDIQVPTAEVIAGGDDTGGESGPPEVVATADTGGEDPPGPPTAPDPLPAGLSGQAPPSDKDTGPPSLAGVLDTTGTPPKDTDLIGHWSVLWFYPAASTSG